MPRDGVFAAGPSEETLDRVSAGYVPAQNNAVSRVESGLPAREKPGRGANTGVNPDVVDPNTLIRSIRNTIADQATGSQVPWYSRAARWLTGLGTGAWSGIKDTGDTIGNGAMDLVNILRGGANGFTNMITGQGWNPSSGMFGYIEPGRLVEATDHAKAPVGGVSRFATNISNGIYNVADSIAGDFGAKPFAKDFINANEDYHRRLQNTLYTDPTRPELEGLENTYSTVAELAASRFPGAAPLSFSAESGAPEDSSDPLKSALFLSMFTPWKSPRAVKTVVDSSILGNAFRSDAASRDYADQLARINEAFADPNSSLHKNIDMESKLNEYAGLVRDLYLVNQFRQPVMDAARRGYVPQPGEGDEFAHVWTDDKAKRFSELNSDKAFTDWVGKVYPTLTPNMLGNPANAQYFGDKAPILAQTDFVRNWLSENSRQKGIDANKDAAILPALQLAGAIPFFKAAPYLHRVLKNFSL